jgi:hypothetical protein
MPTSSDGSSRGLLLRAIAGTMIAAAALAIVILLLGDFGGTGGRVLLTTVVLAAHGALGVPSAVLHDQRRLSWLALAGAVLVAGNAALNVAGIWLNTDSELLGKATGTLWALTIATVATTGLAAWRRRHPLFFPSIAFAYLAAALTILGIWVEPEGAIYFRLLGIVVVLTVLLFALQPLLLRARRERTPRPLRLVDETGGTVDVVVEADSLSEAAERAIRDAERQGMRVRSVEFLRR